VKAATGQALTYVYGRETRADADIAQVLTMDEAAAHRQQHRQAASLTRQDKLVSADS